MFGYVRPLRAELRCREFDLYRAVYCGLCRTMRRRCGWFSTAALNYDFTFLALLLMESDAQEQTCLHRCHIPPFRRRCMACQSQALELAADESVILTYWQLSDKVQDEHFLRGLGARSARLLLRRAYRRAAGRCARFDTAARVQLDRLHRLEEERCAALDPPADAFAKLLCAAVEPTGDDGRDRAMDQLLYHLGRWIYLLDARDDLREDAARGNYNPILLRYRGQACDEALVQTLNQSLAVMRTSSALLDFGGRTGLVENIITCGLPAVQRAVFDGSWKQMKNRRFGEGSYERSL